MGVKDLLYRTLAMGVASSFDTVRNLYYPQVIVGEKSITDEFICALGEYTYHYGINISTVFFEDGDEQAIREAVEYINMKVISGELNNIERLKNVGIAPGKWHIIKVDGKTSLKEMIEPVLFSDMVIFILRTPDYARSIPFRRLIYLLISMTLPVILVYEGLNVAKEYRKVFAKDAPTLVCLARDNDMVSYSPEDIKNLLMMSRYLYDRKKKNTSNIITQ